MGSAAEAAPAGAALVATPLPSWNDTPARDRIIEFVRRVTDTTSSSFVLVEARIAVFDNDGTLWSEKPLYVQLLYAIDYVKTH